MRYHTSFRPGHYWEYAKKAVEAGIDGFEVVQWASYLSDEEQGEYLELVQRIKDEFDVGFTVHAPIIDIHLGSLNRRVRAAALEEIKASLDLARAIDASVVVVHGAPGIITMPIGEWSKQVYQPPKGERELVDKQEAYLVRAIKDLADYAPDILLGVENLVFPHELYRSPEEMQELLRKVNRSNVGVTVDAGHAQVCGYQATEFINLLNDRVIHVHLHDNHGVWDEHLPLGKGVVDYVGLIQTLKKQGFQGVVNLEFSLNNPEQYKEYMLEFK